MSQPTFDYLEAINRHSAGFASAAEGNFAAPVRHCPGWSVADLVHHLTTVHWSWATIVSERLEAPPAEDRQPTRADEAHLLEHFRANAERLVSVLATADPQTRVYTWAPTRQDVAFIIRHQVQEAAVHHWDAREARGAPPRIESPVAVDSIEEFLTFSIASDAYPVDGVGLDGGFALRCRDVEASWTIHDGTRRGTLAFERGAIETLPGITGDASDLLLWLYRRTELDTAEVPELVARFRTLSFTD